MTSSASSFAVAANEASALGASLGETARAVARPTAGFVFLSGELANDARLVARAIARAWPGVPTLVATGAGVMADRGAFEGQSAAAGVLVGGVRACPVVVPPSPDALGPTLAEAIARATEGRPATVPIFASPEGWTAEALSDVARACPKAKLVGGGTLPEPPPIVIDAAGAIHAGPAAGLALLGAPSVIGVSPACHPLGDGPLEITEARGSVVLGLGGEPALDVLSRVAQGLEGRPLVLALYPSAADPSGRRGARVRPIRGVDPGRKAVVVGEPVHAGERLGFAVLDGPSARAALEASLRDLARGAAGALPRFALYVGCAGRGATLYGSSGVDARLVRAQFPAVPFAGVMSAFEIAPSEASAAMHLYTGVTTLFTTPS